MNFVEIMVGEKLKEADSALDIMGSDRKVLQTLNNAEPLWKKLERKQEIREVIITTLIKNGEICGTEILSENLLKMELGEKRVQSLSDRERVFTALNNALRKGRDMAQSRGPLIFVKIDKGYYNAAN